MGNFLIYHVTNCCRVNSCVVVGWHPSLLCFGQDMKEPIQLMSKRFSLYISMIPNIPRLSAANVQIYVDKNKNDDSKICNASMVLY